ncbi:MAG: hypothetical protein P4L40_23185, partial [Terracidiphilus sp.]|nr:hypothetical protein [Terracidiphilus sp.]
MPPVKNPYGVPAPEYASKTNERLWACQLCPDRIDLHEDGRWFPMGQQGAGKAHKRCIDRQRQDNSARTALKPSTAAAAAAAAAAAIPVAPPAALPPKREPKKKRIFDPSDAPPPAPAAPRPPSPPPPLTTVQRALHSLDDGYSVFRSHSTTVLRGEQDTEALARDTFAAVQQLQQAGEGLHGGATQRAVHDLPTFTPLITRYSHLLRTVVLPKLGFSAEQIAQLHLVDFKIIVDGIHTTAMPNFVAERVFTPTQLTDRIARKADGGITKARKA